MATSKTTTTDAASDAAETPTTTPAPTAVPDPIAALATAITTAMQQGNQQLAESIINAQIATQAPRQLTIDEVYERDPVLAAKEQRTRRLTTGPRRYRQNGIRLDSGWIISEEECDLLERLQAGVFVNGLVTVIATQPEGVHGACRIDINHAGATQEQRIALKNEVRNFEELLRRCVEEAEARPRVVLAQ